MKVNDRVGAIQSSRDNKAKVYGYGVYLGEIVPDKLNYRNEILNIFRKAEIKNPAIKLDNGDVIFGCECWWGSEAKLKEIIKDFEIEIVSIKDS